MRQREKTLISKVIPEKVQEASLLQIDCQMIICYLYFWHCVVCFEKFFVVKPIHAKNVNTPHIWFARWTRYSVFYEREAMNPIFGFEFWNQFWLYGYHTVWVKGESGKMHPHQTIIWVDQEQTVKGKLQTIVIRMISISVLFNNWMR